MTTSAPRPMAARARRIPVRSSVSTEVSKTRAGIGTDSRTEGWDGAGRPARAGHTGAMPSDVYFFDCDKTLYDYDFRRRLPRLAEITGKSQYQLAQDWWVGGYEEAAERGEIATT